MMTPPFKPDRIGSVGVPFRRTFPAAPCNAKKTGSRGLAGGCGLGERFPALTHRSPLEEAVGFLAVAEALRGGIPLQRFARV